MPWTWSTTIEATKVVGGLAAAAFALYQYSHQIDQDRSETVRRAVEITHDATAQEFHRQVLELIAPFDPSDKQKIEAASKFYIWSKYYETTASPSKEFYENMLSGHDSQYAFVATFLRQMYGYATSNACTWDVVVEGFRQDAGNFWYYFEPTWDEYAERIHKDPTSYWDPICAMVWNERPAGMARRCQQPWYEELLLRKEESAANLSPTNVTRECRRSRLSPPH